MGADLGGKLTCKFPRSGHLEEVCDDHSEALAERERRATCSRRDGGISWSLSASKSLAEPANVYGEALGSAVVDSGKVVANPHITAEPVDSYCEALEAPEIVASVNVEEDAGHA